MSNFIMQNGEKLIYSAILILVSILIYKVISWPIKHRYKRDKKNKSRDTYFAMLANIARYGYIALVIIGILQIYGIDITAMVAGVGVVSAVLGLALQDTLKDIIRGFSLISEGYYKIGDYVKIGDYSGTVVRLGIRSTRIKDALTGDVITIANSEINRVKTSANLLSIDIPLPYELKLEKAEAIITEIIDFIKQNPDVAECEYLGVNELGDSAIKYRVHINCKENRVQVKRAFLRQTLLVLEKHKVSIPYPQLDVHSK